jgi:hypothetical protein
MRLPFYFRCSSSAPEAARLGLAGSMTHSARVCLGFDAVCLCGPNSPTTNGNYTVNMVTRNSTALDLFHLLPDQRILVCRVCSAGVVPQHLVTHIRAHHRRLYPDFQTKRATTEWVKNRLLTSLPCELLDPLSESIPVPPAKTKAFPVLRLHVGYGCSHCSIVSKREEEIRRHYNICLRKLESGNAAHSRIFPQYFD